MAHGNTLKISKWEDLSGHRVSGELGGIEERRSRDLNDMLKNAGKPGIDVLIFNSASDAFQALRAGQVEAVTINDATAMFLQQRGDFMTETGHTTVAFLRALIAAGRDGDDACQVLFAERLRALGWAVEVVPYRPEDVPMVAEFAGTAALDTGERRSVIARRRGSGGGRSIIFFAHPDGEPHTFANWRHDPFAGTINDGRIYGWGVADDLAGVAAMADAAALLHKSGKSLSGDVILASMPSKRHARGVSALLRGGMRADACVYLHPAESGSGMREIKALASGQLTFRIVVAGRLPDTTEPGHTAFAHLAVNPIDKAMVVCGALAQLDAERGERMHHAALDAACPGYLLSVQVAAGIMLAWCR